MEAKYTKAYKNIGGGITEDEAEALYRLANKSKGAIVEIGSLRGMSTVCLAGGKKKVYAIDTHERGTEEEFDANTKDFKNIVKMTMTSERAAKDFDKPVGLIFIDGDHDYEAVRLDFDLWYPKLVKGGWMAFHDSDSWTGVIKLMDEVMNDKYFTNMPLIGSMRYAKKV